MRRRLLKPIAVFIILNLLFELSFPVTAWALTGGPSQPEVQSFEPAGTTEMVDLFTGDFNYNIPLMDVEGYPINLSYHSGITMDQEASWVGLGWNINPGVINRDMRGLPDDFDGDEISRTYSMKPDETWGTRIGMGFELFGLSKVFKGQKTHMDSIASLQLNFSRGIFYNSYRGVGQEMSISPTFGISAGQHMGLTAGLGLSANSQSGVEFSKSLGLRIKSKEDDDRTTHGLGLNVSDVYNSRSGLKSMGFGWNISATQSMIGINKKGGIEAFSGSAGLNGGGNISFSTQTYVPQLSFPMTNRSFSFRGTLGNYVNGPDIHGYVEGYYSGQKLSNKNTTKKAYGYLHSEDSKGADPNDDVLMDFNREKDVPFTDNIVNLPLANFTYDLYSVSGQGVGGMYRPYRSDIGILHDDYVQSNSGGGSGGVEFAAPVIAHFGGDVNVNFSESYSGNWKPEYLGLLGFQSSNAANSPLYEPAYFKNAGEHTPADEAHYNKIGGAYPVRLGLDYHKTGSLNRDLILGYDDEERPNHAYKPVLQYGEGFAKTKRDKRNQSIQLLSGEQAKYGHSLDSSIRSYYQNTWYTSGHLTGSRINRRSNYRKPHHTTEITALNPDGTRYVYGIPAYNVKQIEGTFSVNDNRANYANGQIYYDPSDRSTGNSKGIDHFYSKTELPAYAHSYLLTTVLSPDYVDVTGDGVTDDDLGMATKINYSRVDSIYHWRVPFRHYRANFEEGIKSNKTDGRGSYLYGEKEMWYVHSIESKNYIAIFELDSSRNDGYGVSGEDGGFGSSDHAYQLKSITLYAKQDFRKFGSSATPIKKVHFEYTHSLCRRVENNIYFGDPRVDTSTTYYNRSGKLTLTKVYFTYGKSLEGQLSSYEFTYSNFDPDYNLKGYDRWGNYKPQLTDSSGSGDISNAEFPYVDQDDRTSKADSFAQAWTLTQIDLPSGGTIKVDYESDDYAYVQDKTAMQMFKVIGFGASSDSTQISSTLYDDGEREKPYLFFKLQSPLTGTFANNKLYDRYLKGIDNLYFNCFVDLVGGGKYEYVHGYAQLDNGSGSPLAYGVVSGGTKAWIRLKMPRVGDKKPHKHINPIAKTAWQFARLHTPELVYPGSNFKATGNNTKTIQSLVGMMMDMKAYFTGYNATALGRGYGQTITPSKSWIRLNSPGRMKLGGGCRVKKIALSDNWGTLGHGGSSADDYEYGQVYSYTTTEKVGSEELTISSGVASYEPIIGNDENPWRQPNYYKNDNKDEDEDNRYLPDNAAYTETPYGESFFPGASVGYSRVVVKNIPREDVTRTATGYTIHEFYTARDYPTIVTQTALKKQPNKGKLLKFLGISNRDFVTASQGYTIELNDMHGKPKRQRVYQEGVDNKNKFISGVEYSYFTDQAYNFESTSPYHLSNYVTLIDRNGGISDGLVAVDMDASVDMRKQESRTWGAGVSFNTEMISLGILGIVFPAIFPNYNKEQVRFNSSVFTKVVQRYGVLQKVTAYEDGSMVSTENLAFDAETGEVLLTRTQNEFQDSIYNFTYPAHWAYDGMGSAAQNVGAHFTDVAFTSDTITLAGGLNPNDYFVPGDEVLTTSPFSVQKHLWVYRNDDHHLIFIKRDGNRTNYTDGCDVTIIRSGRRNMQTMPIGTVTTLTNPIVGTGGSRHLNLSSSAKVINAAALECSDKWTKQCAYVSIAYCDSVTDMGHDLLNLVTEFAQDGNLHNGVSGAFSSYTSYSSSVDFKDYIVGHCSGSYSVTTSNNVFANTSTLSITPVGCSSCAIGLFADDGINFPYDSIVNFSPYAEPGHIPGNTMYVTAIMANGTKRRLELAFDCGLLMKCYNSCILNTESIVNPYITGLRGTWHKTKDYVYLDDRNYYTSSAKPRTDGQYSTFAPFWNYSSSKWTPSTNPNWTWASEVTKVSRTGVDVENKDALNRYTAALYGFNFSLPIAVGSNAKYRQIAYDGFEEYSYTGATCGDGHFNFTGVNSSNLDSTIRHTGRKSLKLSANTSKAANRRLYYCENHTPDSDKFVYRVKPCDCIGLFSPDTGTTYVLGAWVKLDTSAYANTYSSAKIIVDLIENTTHNYHVFRSSGPIIDGWQRIEGTFYIPENMTAIEVTLNASASNATWFDDVRIHPFDGNLKTYAYDNRTLRLMAELDENNYATFYEYDKDGTLIFLKKETVEGIMTLKENRSSVIKH